MEKRDKTCKEVVLAYINSQDNWITKGQIYMVAQEAEFSPESGAREARRLAEHNEIQKSSYDGKYAKGLVRYAKLTIPKVTKPKIEIQIINNKPVAVMV